MFNMDVYTVEPLNNVTFGKVILFIIERFLSSEVINVLALYIGK